MRLAGLLLLLLPSLALAQSEALVYDRPMVDMLGSTTLPMMLIDENTLAGGLFVTMPFPVKPWEEAKACVEALSKGFALGGMRHYTSSSGARSGCTVTPRNSSCLAIRRTRSDVGSHLAAPRQSHNRPVPQSDTARDPQRGGYARGLA